MDPTALSACLQTVADALPWWLLLAGASIGHGYLFFVGLNVFYGWPWPRRLLKFTRKIDVLFIAFGPVYFSLILDIFGSRSLTWNAGIVLSFLSTYTVLCWFIGFGVAPFFETLYLLRRPAPQLVKETAIAYDVAKELGYQPIGNGKDAKLSTLPFNQCFYVEFTEKTFALPNIPDAWDGLTILHLTDLHFCGTPDRAYYHWVMERCMKDGTPDLILLTGDVVDSEWHHRWVVPMLGKLRWNIGAFAILGNHDAWRDVSLIRKCLRRARFTVLANSWQQIEVRGEPMIVIGNECPWFTPLPDLSACPEHIFRLVLSHTPDQIAWARQHKIDLMLAGHVHGGQIRLPVLGSVFVPSRYSRKYDSGTFFEAPTLMHVSRGLAGQHPLRFFCKPEVTRIVLRKKRMAIVSEPRTQ
ncbi:MAG: metallophosphoesterase [Gemmataceae bacterium]|nr:metallophosphoesterase [Gemmataceae bacterium]